MTFEFTPTENGFRIRDRIQNTRTEIGVDGRIELDAAQTSNVRVPLDAAVSFEASELRFSENFGCLVHTPSGEFVTRMGFTTPLDLDPGTYEIDAWFPHFKLYLAVSDSAVRGNVGKDGTRFTFDPGTTVTIGVRSFHQQPAGTVTASQDPREVMRAVSTFGSALKTLSPERSFPTLRGHPPELAIRGRTSIPKEFEPPESEITIEVPPSYESIFTVAPLAYYFGATVQPGMTPRLLADGASFEFDEDSLATAANRLLRHCVLLDCVVRTEGLYPLDLHERTLVEDRVELDAATLYDLPIDERTAHYLEIPFDATDGILHWPYVADIDPAPLNAEALPYLSYRLAAIRSPPAGDTRTIADEPVHSQQCGASIDTRSFLPCDQTDSPTLVDPHPFDAEHHRWIGDGVPVGGVKPTLGSFIRSIDAAPKDATIEQHVVCVDGTDPLEIQARYHDAGAPAETVTVHENPTTAELGDLLMSDIDFLHYRGEVSSDGLDCADGTLDVRTLPRVGVSAFLLDGARSYRQGLSLIHAGGISGAVTINETHDEWKSGSTLGTLLNAGFTMAGATAVLDRLPGDTEFIVVGDGDHQVCKPRGLPLLVEALPDRATDERVTTRLTGFASQSHRVGTLVEATDDIIGSPRLMGVQEYEYTRDLLDDLVGTADEPLIAGGELHWLDDLTADELWNLLR